MTPKRYRLNQQRYEQTEKGKAARARARENEREKRRAQREARKHEAPPVFDLSSLVSVWMN